jgi:hypothetical protein
MSSDETVWIEVECRTSDYHVRTFRGRARRGDVESVLDGGDVAFLRLTECYWYNDADDARQHQAAGRAGLLGRRHAQAGKATGTFQRLGYDEYSNFTGESNIRSATILSVSYLKAGFDGEPKADL